MLEKLTITPCSNLNLKNGGKLQLYFIGVGSMFSELNDQLNLLIIKGDTHILVDFGMTGPKALKRVASVDPMDIEVIFPTHSHADHIGGVEYLGLQNRYIGQRLFGKPKLKMIIAEEWQRVLWENSLRGGMEYNEEQNERNLSFSDFFDVIRPQWKINQSRQVHEIEYGEIKLEIFRTKHIPDSSGDWETSFISQGLFIDERIFFSGDTRFDKELIDLYADKSEVMFHDVQFFGPGGVHAPLADLKNLPWNIKSKMFLMGYSDDWVNQSIADFADWTWPGHIYQFD